MNNISNIEDNVAAGSTVTEDIPKGALSNCQKQTNQ